MSMKVKLLAALFVFSSYPAMAQPLPDQVLSGGDDTVVTGRAQVYDTALGTYIFVNRPDASVPIVAGFIPFGNQDAFPDLASLDGQEVEMHGVVGMDGWPTITLSSPDQLRVTG